MRRARGVLLIGGLAALAAILLLAVPAKATVDTAVTPLQWAQAMEATPGLVTGVTVIEQGAGSTPFGIANAPMTFFPSAGGSFSVLVAGNAATADDPNGWVAGQTCGNMCQSGFNGNSYNGANDVTILKVDLNVPATSSLCNAAVPTIYIDYQFLSEEWDWYVGQSFNDAFLAELDITTWSVAGATLTAPDNFAVDGGGGPLSVNSASMNNANAITSAFNGGTAMFNAIRPTTAGAHSIYFSIFDATDSALDSAAFIDNLRVCAPPPVPPIPPIAQFEWVFTTTDPYDFDLDPVQFSDLSTFQYAGSARTWSWTLGDGATDTVQNPLHTYADNGLYEVCLTITETHVDPFYGSYTGTDTVCHDVLVNNRPPSGSLALQESTGWLVTMQGVGSDMDGTIATWYWLFGDGSYSYEQNPSHLYPRNGQFRVCLVVTDNDGATDMDCGVAHVYIPPEERQDTDLDGIADSSDNCAGIGNEDQSDLDHDGRGDACEEAAAGEAGTGDAGMSAGSTVPASMQPPDTDLDGTADPADNCADIPNRDQADSDGDSIGDICDQDLDGDGAANAIDSCPQAADRRQTDLDGDGLGDACEDVPATGTDSIVGGSACTAACVGSERARPAAAPAAATQDMTVGIGIAVAAMAAVLLAVLVVARMRRGQR